jgi:hypothetical protein
MKFLKILSVLIFLSISFAFNTHAKDWEMIKGDNFIIYYRVSVSEDFVRTVLDSAEDDFKQVSENLGLSRYQSWGSEDKRASIYIYADENDYVTNGAQAGWSHGATSIASRTIKTYPADGGFFDALMPHELSHMILHEFVGPYASIPLWFDEGVAMYQEKAKHIGATRVVKDALEKGEFIPLTQLTDMRLYNNSKRETVDLFYAESASIVNFMVTQLGESHFRKLCRELKENTPFVDTLHKVYMHIDNIDDLNKRWVDYLKGN